MSTIALVTWPLLTLFLTSRMPFQQVIIVSLIGGYLLLPTQPSFDLPLLPPLNKSTIPTFTLLALALVVLRTQTAAGGFGHSPPHEMPGWVPRSTTVRLLLAMIALGSLMTAVTNGDRLFYGPTVVNGLRLYDGFSMALTGFTAVAPLLLGRKFFAHPDSHQLLLRGLVIAGVGYSFLALFEIRMSPQLNNMVYGFFPHSWQQHVRSGGWRPLVFMSHGLQLAMFFALTILAAFGLSRLVRPVDRSRYVLAGVLVLGTLILSRSLGATIIVFLLLPVVLFATPRMQTAVAGLLAGTILLFPMLRSVDLVPTERLVSIARTINDTRGASLNFRFENEDVLLEHARERPFFGWGIWSRSRVYNERGEDTVVTDGLWVIVMGESGWVGYVAQFGLLTIPLMFMALRYRRYEIDPVTALLCLVLAANLIDLIPNAFRPPLVFLIAGALWGRLELGRLAQAEPEAQVADEVRVPVYARRRPTAADPRGPAARGRPKEPADGTPAYTRQTSHHRRPKKSC